MVVRVPTYMSYQNYTNRMLETQSKYAKYSYQATTGKISDNYKDIGKQTRRLVGMENDLAKNQQYVNNNTIASLRLENTYNSVEGVNSAVKNFNKTMLDFTKLDLADFAPTYGAVAETIEGGVDTTGDITFNTSADVPPNTIVATKGDAFAGIEAGDKIELEPDGAAMPNEGIFYVESVSTDGRVITVAESTPIDTAITVPTGFDVNIGICETEYVSPEKLDEVENMQFQAFNTLKEMEFFLNTRVDGQYIFGGGESNDEPVSFPFNNLTEFQEYYDGQKVTFPETRAAMLVDMDFDANTLGDLTFQTQAPPTTPPDPPTPTNADTGIITSSNAEAFIKDKIVASQAVTGDIAIDATANSLTVEKDGAFSKIKAGDTIVLGGADANGPPPPALPGGHAQVAYVERVSDDGKTLFFSDDTSFDAGDLNLAVDPTTDFTIGRSLPVGSTIELDGYDNSVDSHYTVLSVSNDGTSINVRTEPNEFPPDTAPVTFVQTTESKIETNSYYNGDHLEIEQRISDTKSIEIGLNAENPSFEKIFRGLGILCQGNIIDERDPYSPALASPVDTKQALTRTNLADSLIQDAMNHDTREQIELPGDLTSTLQDLSLKQTFVDKVQKEQENYVDLLGIKIDEIENADPTEAVINLQQEQLNLSISYSVMSQINGMSLLNFIK